MKYIFLDESGELGFKETSSRYFIIDKSKTNRSLREDVSWAIFRNYEYKDSRFIDIIKDKIVIKKEVFEKLSGP